MGNLARADSVRSYPRNRNLYRKHMIMRVRPKDNYHLLGTDIRLNKDKIYLATWATNQPDWQKDGKIFVNEILLNRGEYKFVAQG